MESKPSFTVNAGIDDNYLLPFLVMVYSAKINSQVNFHISLGFDARALSSNNRELLAKVLNLIDVSFSFVELELSEDMGKNGYLPATTYSRLLLADKNSGLMIWLDSDLLCLPRWDSLFIVPDNLPNGKVLSAVRDAKIFNLGSSYAKQSNNESLRIMGTDYFNTGVILIDCDTWKNLNYPQKWPKLLEEYDTRGFEWQDQCILNFLCQRQVNYLPWEYNTFSDTRKRDGRLKPYILHFTGTVKPWHYSVIDPRILTSLLPSSDIYMYLRYQSRLIRTIGHEDLDLGLILSEEQKRIRGNFRFVIVIRLIERAIKVLTFKDLAKKRRLKAGSALKQIK